MSNAPQADPTMTSCSGSHSFHEFTTLIFLSQSVGTIPGVSGKLAARDLYFRACTCTAVDSKKRRPAMAVLFMIRSFRVTPDVHVFTGRGHWLKTSKAKKKTKKRPSG